MRSLLAAFTLTTLQVVVACAPSGLADDSGGSLDDAAVSGAADPSDADGTHPAAGLPVLTAHAYTCEGSYVVTKLEEGGSLYLFLPDETRKLIHVPAASGSRYSDESVTFWSKGVEAMLERGEESRTCLEDRKASLIEDAKLRGVDFRGSGNEPPWILEMGPDAIVVYTGYESAHHRFPPVEPHSDAGARRSQWATENVAGESLMVTIAVPGDSGPCRDSMADDTFSSTVELVLNERILRGCGAALH